MITSSSVTEPLFCTRADCPWFKKEGPPGWFCRNGFHSTKAHGKVPRFRCKFCHKTFSIQTFLIDFYTKRRLDWRKFEELLTSRPSDRALGRYFGLAPAAIQNRIDRLAKGHIRGHTKILNAASLNEDLVADGFETFSIDQYHPCHVTIAAGSDSQVAFSWSYAPIRRKGRMTPFQLSKRAELEALWKPSPQAIKKSFTSGVIGPLHRLLSRSDRSSVTLFTDEYKAYAQAVAQDPNRVTPDLKIKYHHKTISSKAKRTQRNPLFSVNYLDRELRKDLGNHGRETVTFSRNPNDMMNRMTVELSRHNLSKGYRMKDKHLKNFTHWHFAYVENPALIEVLEKLHTIRPWREPEDFGEDFLRVWDRSHPSPLALSKRYKARFWSQ